jgi:hypothetical protein
MKNNKQFLWERGIVFLLNLDGWKLDWVKEELGYSAKGKTPKGFDCVMEFKLLNKYYPAKALEKAIYNNIMVLDCFRFYYVFDCKGNYLYLLDNLKLGTEANLYLLSESQASILNKY